MSAFWEEAISIYHLIYGSDMVAFINDIVKNNKTTCFYTDFSGLQVFTMSNLEYPEYLKYTKSSSTLLPLIQLTYFLGYFYS